MTWRLGTGSDTGAEQREHRLEIFRRGDIIGGGNHALELQLMLGFVFFSAHEALQGAHHHAVAEAHAFIAQAGGQLKMGNAAEQLGTEIVFPHLPLDVLESGGRSACGEHDEPSGL